MVSKEKERIKKNQEKIQDEMQDQLGVLDAPSPQPLQMTRVSGYVLMDHPPMRIMGRFFIWEILNMPGVGKGGKGEEIKGRGREGRERRGH